MIKEQQNIILDFFSVEQWEIFFYELKVYSFVIIKEKILEQIKKVLKVNLDKDRRKNIIRLSYMRLKALLEIKTIFEKTERLVKTTS